MSASKSGKFKHGMSGTGLIQDKTSRASYFKKSIFRYTAQIGHLPREVESFLFIQRTDHKTGVTKIIPEVVYPIQANRPAVPKHELLEDDWRAFRSVLQNYQTVLRSQMDPNMRQLELLKCGNLVNRIYGLHRTRRQVENTIFVPTLAMYKDSVDAPLGYSYRRYKQGSLIKQDETGPRSERQQLKIPVLVFEGPFMDVVHIPQGKQVKAEWDQEMQQYDADVIVTRPCRRKLYIYNEPDAIPVACARNDFSQPLSERAKNAVTNYSHVTSGDDAEVQAHLLSNVLATNPNLPFPELMGMPTFPRSSGV